MKTLPVEDVRKALKYKRSKLHLMFLPSNQQDADDEDDYLQENQYETVLDGTVNLSYCLMHVITPKHSN